MMATRTAFPVEFRELASDCGLEMQEVARAIGVSPQKLCNSMKGNARLTPDEVVRSADVFGIRGSERLAFTVSALTFFRHARLAAYLQTLRA